MPEKSPTRPLSEADLQLWREAMTHLRHLSDDVFRSVVFFTGLNVVALGTIIFLMVISTDGSKGAWICVATSVAGLALTFSARFILKRHRIYYLEMLAKKSLLELELGFYDKKFTNSDVDFALPWRLKPEVVHQIAKNFDAWVQKSIRSRGTMVRIYFLIYEVLILVYAIVTLLLLYRFFQ
jgi:hypothetical protein